LMLDDKPTTFGEEVSGRADAAVGRSFWSISRRAIANNNKVGARLGDCVVAGCDLAPTRSADAIDDSLSVQDSNLGEGHQAARMQERCVGFATAEPEALRTPPDFGQRPPGAS